VFGVVAVSNAFLPALRRSAHPRIVNVSSGTGSLTWSTGPNPQFDYQAAGMGSGAAYRSSKTALDALRDWMAGTMGMLDSSESNGAVWERPALRAHIINIEPELRGRARAGYYEFDRVLADAIGHDLSQPGTALTPRLAALTAITGLRELYETNEAESLPSPPTAAGLLALVDRVIAFTQAGIDGSTDAPSTRRQSRTSPTEEASTKHR
jgi:hypothetical protein